MRAMSFSKSVCWRPLLRADDMKELTENLAEMIAGTDVLLLQFGEEMCAPCRAIRLKLDRWLSERPEVQARYVDIPSHMEESAQMGIFSAPAVMAFLDGQMAVRESGYFSVDNLLARLDRYLKIRAGGA